MSGAGAGLKPGWEMVIGLEVHVQLATESKLFSTAPTLFGSTPNSQMAPLDAGLPGTLPTLNRRAVEQAIRLGHALNAQICPTMQFERKHYFYPDLPKGYQITQLEQPIVSDGHLDIETAQGEAKRVRINRAHIEEDAGKSLHEGIGKGHTGVDLNRAGMPLLEIVTEPDLAGPEEAVSYLKQLHQLVRWLRVSRGHMAEGSMRCDANVSVRRAGSEQLGTRCEIKNLNSFRFVEQAIAFEADRQVQLLESGGQIEQQTRLYDESNRQTRRMRGKEESADYRYFPEPDLLPIELDPAWIEQIRQQMPELPVQRMQRYREQLGLDKEPLLVLTAERDIGEYFEQVAEAAGDHQAAANWMAGPVTAALKGMDDESGDGIDFDALPMRPQMLAGLLRLLERGAISGPAAREIFEQLWREGGDPAQIVEEKGLGRIGGEDELRALAQQAVDANPAQAQQYRDGKDKLMGFFVGQVMKATGGRADPKILRELLEELLRT